MKAPIELGPLGPVVLDYLRTRRDLLPDPQAWLAPAIGDAAVMVPFADIRTLIEEDLERELERAYLWVDPAPLRRGPLTQVHLARTVGGREVALKVQHPNAAALVARELPALERALAALAHEARLATADADELGKGLRVWLADAIDAPAELDNLERLDAVKATHPLFEIPKPRADLSGPRVVVFEALRGVPFDEILRLLGEKRRDRIERLEIDRTELGISLVRSVLHQMLVQERFVANLSPAHLMALSGDRLSYLDFSHVGRVDPVIRRNQFRFMSSVSGRDVERMLGALADLVEAPGRESIEKFEMAFRQRMREWELDEKSERAPSTGLADRLMETLHLARAHGLQLQEPALNMLRTLHAADAVAQRLSPRAGLGAAAPAFSLQMWAEGIRREVWQERLPSLGFDLVDLITDSPGNLVRILSDVADRRFVLRVQTVESEESRVAASTRARLLAVSGLFIGVCVMASALWLSKTPSPIAWGLIGIAAVALLVAFAALWRRLT